MSTEQLRDYCLALKGTTEHFPFDEVTLVFKVMNKMFAIIPLDNAETTISLKCDPERALDLRDQYPDQIQGGFHLNKKHWNQLAAEQLSAALVRELIDHSYALVVASLKKAEKQALNDL